MSKHTPGPWRLTENGTIRNVDGQSVAKVQRHHNVDWQESGRLIAAAPELLEALESAIRQYAGVLILAETGRYATDEMIEKVIDMCTPESPFGQLVAVAKKARGAK